jgi:predicted GH43/DUF377 family glycosyl hydrolase
VAHSPDYAKLFGREIDPTAKPQLRALRTVRIDPAQLINPSEGKAFNASMIRWKGQLILVHRTGWAGSNIRLVPLNDNYEPTDNPITLNLTHPAASFGREDPRLFIHNDRLHVAFTGFTGGVTHVLYAVLRDDFTTEAIHAPHYNGRRGWEKNWSFFSEKGELYAVYSIDPHVTLKIEGNVATVHRQGPTSFPWRGGHLRGGASPVRIGNEWYHWFHGAIDLGAEWPTRQYNTGLYTFQPHSHRVMRLAEQPVSWANMANRPKDQYCSVEFIGGAIYDDARQVWVNTYGIHDRWIEIREYAHADVAKWLGIPQRKECLNLGKRTEFRPGCGGWTCQHECSAGKPVAVPGGCCQSCELWEDASLPESA